MMTTNNRHDLPPIATTGEIADFFHVSLRTVQRWETDGLLLAMKLPGRLKRYRREDALALASAADPSRRRISGAAVPA
jgi:phage terminase Nu1 subunit (DNA packaging protein)